MDPLLALYHAPRLIADGETLIVAGGWIRLAVWSISVAALATVSFLELRRGRRRRYGWLGIGVALVVAGLVIPGVARERITITPLALRIDTGPWFEPVTIEYRLTDFERAHEVTRETNWFRTDHYLILEAGQGPHRRYRMSDFFRANRELIFARLAAAGLEVERAPPDD